MSMGHQYTLMRSTTLIVVDLEKRERKEQKSKSGSVTVFFSSLHSNPACPSYSISATVTLSHWWVVL